MTYTFCTLFDKNYLYRGLALYDSLEKHCVDFKIYILCLDQETFDLLTKFKLTRAELVKLSSIEGEKLLRAKSNRSVGEYCWTLGSVFTYYLLKKYPDIKELAYLDSDIYFYSSPQPIYDELSDKSILIIRHNYSPALEYLAKRSGIYNVAMVIFKNDEYGLACLTWWQDACLTWCYNRLEDGKFGDQMYLDTWPLKFKGVHVLEHSGGDVAPWNVARYNINRQNDKLMVANNQELIFYHFHTLKLIKADHFQLYSSFYRLPKIVDELIYLPYLQDLRRLIKMVQALDPNFKYGFSKPETSREKLRQRVKRILINILYLFKKYESTKDKS